jgi:signal transduction histidine kinase
VGGSPLDQEALSGRPAIVTDSQSDPRAANAPGDFCSILCVGLVHDGTPVGTLHAYAKIPQRFTDDDAARLMSLADLGAAAVIATRAAAALEALDASKGQFIRVATHELRSPVAVAQSLVRGVLQGYAGEMTEKQTDVFGRISRRLDFLESLVNDLLDLAAGKAPELAEDEEPTLLNAAVRRAVLLFQPRAEEKGVELVNQRCSDQLVVWGTEGGLDRVFTNLISNAVKYTPSGGSVTVAVRQVDGQAQVKVADTGIGIPENALPHLFEEFYRAPNAKASSEVGTGLGLSIVKDLVERYGGRIEVESEVEKGATFTVTLPVLSR